MHRAIPRIAAFTLAVGCGLPAFLLPLSGFLLTLPFLAVLALSLAEITPRRVALGARFVATALCLTLLILTERAWLLPPVPTGFLFVLLTALTFAHSSSSAPSGSPGSSSSPVPHPPTPPPPSTPGPAPCSSAQTHTHGPLPSAPNGLDTPPVEIYSFLNVFFAFSSFLHSS